MCRGASLPFGLVSSVKLRQLGAASCEGGRAWRRRISHGERAEMQRRGPHLRCQSLRPRWLWVWFLGVRHALTWGMADPHPRPLWLWQSSWPCWMRPGCKPWEFRLPFDPASSIQHNKPPPVLTSAVCRPSSGLSHRVAESRPRPPPSRADVSNLLVSFSAAILDPSNPPFYLGCDPV